MTNQSIKVNQPFPFAWTSTGGQGSYILYIIRSGGSTQTYSVSATSRIVTPNTVGSYTWRVERGGKSTPSYAFFVTP